MQLVITLNLSNDKMYCSFSMIRKIHSVALLIVLTSTGSGYIKHVTDCIRLEERAGKYGYVDSRGKVMLDFIWDDAYPFSEGCAVVKRHGKYGAINRKGEVVIPFVYEWLEMFHEGLARFQKNKKTGFINRAGSCVIKPVWLEAEPFSCGLARVSHDRNKWGYINKSGDVAIPLVWDYAFSFFYNRALVRKGNGASARWGAINTRGEEVIEPNWSELRNLDKNYLLAGITKDDLRNGYIFAIIDKRGKLVTGYIFFNPKPLEDRGKYRYSKEFRCHFFTAEVKSNPVVVHNSGLYGRLFQSPEGLYQLRSLNGKLIAQFDEKGEIVK